MSKENGYKTNCDSCGSSDGNHVYADHTYCYVCEKRQSVNGKADEGVDTTIESSFVAMDTLDSIATYDIRGFQDRGITKQVSEYFEVRCSYEAETREIDAHFYPYTCKGKVTSYKKRLLPKSFSVVGDFKNIELFGQSKATGGKTLIITEGELDCMAVAQAFMKQYNRIFPVVSLPSAAGTKAVLENRDWVNKFESVVLLFDNDPAGQKAIEVVSKIIGAGKVKIGQLQEKDACDELLTHGHGAIMQAIWNARIWSPAGIVVGEDIWDQYKERRNIQSVPFPTCLQGLNEKLKGIRHGEITLFTSGTGSGKSTVIKEIVLDLLAKTDDKIGLISLEESVADTAEKFISMSCGTNISTGQTLSEDDQRAGFDAVFADERLVLLDHQGSVGDSSLIDKIEYMALMGCKYLVLDHITIAISEGSEGLSGNEAVDKMMSDLLKIVKKHNVWLGLISHLRKAYGGTSFEEGKLASIDDIKGSGSIKQISFDIIAFARNLIAEEEAERNTIKFRVLKSRFTGLTGDAGSATYNSKTARLVYTGEFNVIGGL